MNFIKNLLVQKKLFWILYLLFFIAGMLLVLFTDQYELHQNINSYHQPFWDFFFKYATYLGDGILYPLIIVCLFFIKREWVMAFIYAALLSLILSYLLKHYVFTGHPRPYEIFGNSLHLIEGVKMKHWNSFPSGHTLSAFSMFSLGIFFAKKHVWQILWFGLALIAAISRVYLSQHFVEDILGGSIIGIAIALAGYTFWYKYPLKKPKP